jgi:arylsulfatase A-like enzyme
MAVATNPAAAPEMHRVARWLDHQRFGNVDFSNLKLELLFPAFESVSFFPAVELVTETLDRFMGFMGRYSNNQYWDAESALAQARELLAAESRNAGPEFLWVHVLRPHSPYATPAPFLRSFDPSDNALTVTTSNAPHLFMARTYKGFPEAFSGRYDEAIRYADYHVGRFLDWLKTEGYYENSMIIVTADHGESFAHSYGSHGGPMMYEDLIHVPLLVKLPGQHNGSRIRDLVTEHADLFPTILDCLDLPAPVRSEGRSFRPALDGRALEPRPVFSMILEESSISGPIENGTVASVNGRYKYVRHLGRVSYPEMPKLEDEFYDVISDPAETTDLAATKPEIAAGMRTAIDAAVSQYSRP